MELPVGIPLVLMLCWTWGLVQLLLHSAVAVTALHVEEARAWSVVHGTGWRRACAESGLGSCCFMDLSLSIVDLYFMGGLFFHA